MFTSNGFRLYNTKTFFSVNPVLSCFSAVTLHSSKISDSVRPDRSLIVTTSSFSISFLLCFTVVSSICSSKRTTLDLSDSAQGALNIHVKLLSSSGCMMVSLHFFTKLLISEYFVSFGKAQVMPLSINLTTSLSSFS